MSPYSTCSEDAHIDETKQLCPTISGETPWLMLHIVELYDHFERKQLSILYVNMN